MRGIARWLVVVALTSGGLLACQRSRSPEPSVSFFPLHAEDTWVYEVTRPLRNKHTRMTVRARGDKYVAALKRRCSLVEESYAADEDNGGRPEIYPIAYYRENGFLYRALSLEYRNGQLQDIGLGSSEERFLPDQLAANTSWESETTAYKLGVGDSYGVSQHHRVVVEPGAVTVPAGSFSNCLRVDTVAVHHTKREGKKGHEEPVTLYYADWYAPNVGLVRTVQWSRPDGGPPLSTIELVAYDVEGAQR